MSLTVSKPINKEHQIATYRDVAENNSVKKRTRLAPEKRKALILDMAAKIVNEEGISAVSMERIGREANVSKALVYNYFSNRTELLAALLRRDFTILKQENREVAEHVENFEEMIRLMIRNYLHHILERGLTLKRLQNEPAVVALVQQTHEDDYQTDVRYLMDQTKRRCHLSENVFSMAVDICQGLVETASKFIEDSEMNFQLIEDICVNMTFAGLASITQVYGHGVCDENKTPKD